MIDQNCYPIFYSTQNWLIGGGLNVCFFIGASCFKTYQWIKFLIYYSQGDDLSLFCTKSDLDWLQRSRKKRSKNTLTTKFCFKNLMGKKSTHGNVSDRMSFLSVFVTSLENCNLPLISRIFKDHCLIHVPHFFHQKFVFFATTSAAIEFNSRSRSCTYVIKSLLRMTLIPSRLWSRPEGSSRFVIRL